MVANRTQARAVTLAARIGAEPVALVEVPDRVADIDLLLTSTGSQAPIIERSDLEPVMSGRSRRPLLVVDIAVPRDVDPAVADIDGVTLLDMDDLRGFAAAGVAGRRA